jgi:hypothetical protein
VSATGLLCLRCDWSGQTQEPRCPRCGVALYRSEPSTPAHDRIRTARARPAPVRRPPRLAPATTSRTSPPPPEDPASRLLLDGAPGLDDAPDLDEGTRLDRGRRSVGVAFLILIVVAVAARLGGASEEPSPAPPSVAGLPELTGKLIYVRGGSGERVQLWSWDLASGTVVSGPTIPRPLELVGMAGSERGVVGMTWRSGNALRAGVLRSLEPEATPRLLLVGGFISWGARGQGVSGAVLEPDGRCYRLTVGGIRVDTSLFDTPYTERFCGEVLSIGRGAGSITYLTVRRDGAASIVYPGIEELREVLPDHALGAVSWAGDMVVLHTGTGDGRMPLGSEEPSDPAELPFVIGSAYFSQGVDRGAPPQRYGSDDHPFLVERVLAWSPDSFEALALGSLGDRRGVYRLDTLVGDGIDPPVLVAEGASDAWATYMGDGRALVTIDYRLHVVADGVARELEVEPGIAFPDGPLAWIP